MSLYKRGGVYHYDFVVHGRRYRSTTGCERKADADKVERQMYAEAERDIFGLQKSTGKLSFEEMAEEFSKTLVPPNYSENTCKSYLASLKLLRSFFGSMQVAKITPADIVRYRNERLATPDRRFPGGEKKIKGATVNREVEVISVMFNKYRDQLRLGANPCEHVERIPERRRMPYCLSFEDQPKILEACNQAPSDDFTTRVLLRAAIVVVSESGVRIYRELTSLRKENFKVSERWLEIPESKTDNGCRTQPLTDWAFEELRKLRNTMPESEWLFPSALNPERPVPQTSIQKAWDRTLARAGVPHFKIYALRSTFAIRALRAGVPERFVKDMLGHTGGGSVFAAYARAGLLEMREALAKLERYREQNYGSFMPSSREVDEVLLNLEV